MNIPRSTSLLSGGQVLVRALPGLAPTFLVVALLACVLVPLPTALVDLLLSISLSGAVLLLVASLGIRRTAEFLSFPSLLLLVTLFRLALNISTTRLILSQADAGRVIDAFAGVVVRGDLIVGGVMFAIITIVQYLVIARGAERVAEVGARFALDALPGRQASIEADLRAGLISAAEAARRRARLAEMSNFYGAMDGAVRFVKGDAIAGLAITAINLAGGVAIGVLRHDLDVGGSLDVYGRLTIGDGLLAQIPALLVSLGAGVLVARVDRESEPTPGLATWLEPAMLFVPSTLLVVLAFIPTMPTLAFLSTATALVTTAFVLAARVSHRRQRVEEAERGRNIRVALSPEDAPDPRSVERTLAAVHESCCNALGIEVPDLDLQIDPSQPSGKLELRLGDRLLARVSIDPTPSDDALAVAVFRAVMDHATALVDLQELDRALEDLRSTHPVVVRKAMESLEPGDLLAVMRGFLRERIPMPPLHAVLSTIAESRVLRDPAQRAELPARVRERLAAHWLPPLVDGLHRVGTPRWVRLDADAEQDLLAATVTREEGLVLTMDDGERAEWVEQIRGETEGGPVVIVATPRARRAAAELVASVRPHIHVLSTTELDGAGVATGRVERLSAP